MNYDNMFTFVNSDVQIKIVNELYFIQKIY
jgi:hypothetical protein